MREWCRRDPKPQPKELRYFLLDNRKLSMFYHDSDMLRSIYLRETVPGMKKVYNV